MYVCSHRRQGTGVCHADPSRPTSSRATSSTTSTDSSATPREQARGRDDGRQQLLQKAQRLRGDPAEAERRRERVLAGYEKALAEDDPTARLVLEVAARIDAEHEVLAEKIADAEAVASEWDDVDDSGLEEAVDLVKALAEAGTAQALNRALSRP